MLNHLSMTVFIVVVISITATTIIGLGLAVLVVYTKRLGSAISAHVLMNASGVVLALTFAAG